MIRKKLDEYTFVNLYDFDQYIGNLLLTDALKLLRWYRIEICGIFFERVCIVEDSHRFNVYRVSKRDGKTEEVMFEDLNQVRATFEFLSIAYRELQLAVRK